MHYNAKQTHPQSLQLASPYAQVCIELHPIDFVLLGKKTNWLDFEISRMKVANGIIQNTVYGSLIILHQPAFIVKYQGAIALYCCALESSGLQAPSYKIYLFHLPDHQFIYCQTADHRSKESDPPNHH